MPTAFHYTFGHIKMRYFNFTFSMSQCKQTNIDKVVKKLEDPFPCVCGSVTYSKSRNVVNAVTSGHSLLMFTLTQWGVICTEGYVTDQSVKAINLIFAWQILDWGPCPLSNFIRK